MPTLICPQCSWTFEASVSRTNRAAAIDAPLYCGIACAGLGRRKAPVPEAERKAAKSAYDSQRHIRLADRIKAEKAAWFKRTYDPVKAAQQRQKTMPRHVEYCRTPEYRVKKSAYDRKKRFEAFGVFAESAMLLEKLDQEINARATRYEIYIANGRFTRSAQQRQALWETLYELRTGSIQPGQGDAIAAQAREILRTVKVQLQVTSQAKRSVPVDVITFSEK